MLRSRSCGSQGRFVAIVSALVLSTIAYGGKSNNSSAPTAPTSPTSAGPTTATLTGQVVSLTGGAPISGIAVDANGVAATSDGQGMFSVTIPSGATAERIVMTAPQILSRTVFVARTERFHASIAYARPVGNMDPDIDPSTTIRVAPQIAVN